MGITSAIILYVVIWFMVMFVTLPIGLRTQGDENDVVPGTHPSSPANFRLGRTMLIVTAVTTVLFFIIAGVILSGVIKISELGWV
jgi:predicted secreted protein